MLEKLEAEGLVRLPKKRLEKVHTGKRARVVLSERTRAGEPLRSQLRDVAPVRLEPTTEAADVRLWNEYVARYHPLGYKEAFGNRPRYFIRSESQSLGCVFLGGAAKAIAVRDHWFGWSNRARLRNLPWVINNTRFLIFPWVHRAHQAAFQAAVLLLHRVRNRPSKEAPAMAGVSPSRISKLQGHIARTKPSGPTATLLERYKVQH